MDFFDGLQNMINGLMNKRQVTATNRIVSQRIPFEELRQIYKTGIGETIIGIKSGYALKDCLQFKDEEQKTFYDENLKQKVKQAVKFMLGFGRSIVVITEYAKGLDEPLTHINNRGEYKLDVFSGDLVSTYTVNYDLKNPRFLKPEFYSVRGYQIHYSRVVDFKFVEPPEMDKPTYQHGGISLLELIYEQMINDAVIQRCAPAVMEKNSSFFYKIKGFKNLLSTNRENEVVKFYNRLEDLRSVMGAGLIDKDDEIQTVEQKLTDIDKVDQLTLRRLAMVSGIPVSLLVGENVRGLNSTGDVEKQVFDERNEIFQDDYLYTPINELLTKLGKDRFVFGKDQSLKPKDQAIYEKTIVENAINLMNMGEDYNKYLVDKGIIKEQAWGNSDEE